jgi:transposase
MPKGQLFSGEFKQRVVEDVLKNHISYNEAMKKYGIKGRSKIQQWERVYLTEGAPALYIDHRGRKSTERPAKLPKQVEEDLLAENQRLRMEIDYLKKLNALVFKEKQQSRKRK